MGLMPDAEAVVKPPTPDAGLRSSRTHSPSLPSSVSFLVWSDEPTDNKKTSGGNARTAIPTLGDVLEASASEQVALRRQRGTSASQEA